MKRGVNDDPDDPKQTLDPARRKFMLRTLFGAGMVGLRSLATGIPISILLNPRSALAQTAPATCTTTPQYLIYASSVNGDPLNANVPGMYSDPNIAHPLQPSMAPTAMTLAGTPTTAAAPWAALPQNVLDRTVFFHHGTYTVVHPDLTKVMTLENNVSPVTNGASQHDMLVSMIARYLQPCLNTVQAEPIVLGPRSTSESVTVLGRPQPIISPTSLSSLLGSPSGILGSLTSLRDSSLNSLNAWFKQNGNSAQGNFIDRYSTSQTQARMISQSLLTTLSSIPDNSQNSMMTAALTLCRMNVSPAVGVHIAMGGDNHTDTLLAGEAAQQVAGVATINNLMTQLAAAGMQDQVSFMSLNVFGRTLLASANANGRNHQGNHHVMVMIGKPFKGGIIGGVEASGGDYRATSISSATGAAVTGNAGDITITNTLQSAGKTLGIGLGVDPTTMNASITGGKSIPAALATS